MKETTINNYLGKYSLQLSPEFEIENHFLTHGSWEHHVTSCIQYFVRPGDTCIDVGANNGFHSLAMADAVGEDGHVYAFEPNNLTHPRLCTNVDLNPELKNRIVIEKAGLSNAIGELKLFQSGDRPGNAYMADELNPKLWNAGGKDDYQSCPITTLDTYIAGRAVNFMKVDVEGMELEVLLGALETLANFHPIICYETLTEYFDNDKIFEVERLLRSLGYELFCIHPQLGRTIPVSFPHYTADTIAIPRDQVTRYATIMGNTALYNVYLDEQSTAALDMVILCRNHNDFVIGISDDSPTPTFIQFEASLHESTLTTNYQLNGNSVQLSMKFEPNAPSPQEANTTLHGSATIDGVTCSLRAVRARGCVTNYSENLLHPKLR